MSDPELANALAELFRTKAVVLGGTAGALRLELATGITVGGRSHAQKARERVRQLRKLIESDRLSSADQGVATWVATDLERALRGQPRC